MELPKFELSGDLPAVKVDKDFLEILEKYLLLRAGQFFEIPAEELSGTFSLEIVDQLGTETFATIGQFRPSRFSDSTRRVILKLNIWPTGAGRVLRLNLEFHRSRIFTTFSIFAQAADAREFATGLKAGLDNLMSTQGTFRTYLNPHPLVTFFGVVGIAVLLGSLMSSARDKWALLRSIGMLVLLVYPWLCSEYVPYTIFDSKREDRLENIIKWGLTSTAGALATGLLFFIQNF